MVKNGRRAGHNNTPKFLLPPPPLTKYTTSYPRCPLKIKMEPKWNLNEVQTSEGNKIFHEAKSVKNYMHEWLAEGGRMRAEAKWRGRRRRRTEAVGRFLFWRVVKEQFVWVHLHGRRSPNEAVALTSQQTKIEPIQMQTIRTI